MTFNEKIDKYMSENNIPNLKQFALKTAIPYTTLKDFYDKKSADNSRLSTIRKLAEYMNCTMDYLSYDEVNDFNGSFVDADIIIPKMTADILYSKVKDLSEDKQKMILNVTETIINQIDEQEKKE